jgi:hypothetical protein
MFFIKNMLNALLFYFISKHASVTNFPYSPRGPLLNRAYRVPGNADQYLTTKVLGNSNNFKDSVYINGFMETLAVRKASQQEVIPKNTQVALIPKRISFSSKQKISILLQKSANSEISKLEIQSDKFNWLNNSTNFSMQLILPRNKDFYISKQPVNLKNSKPHLFLMIFVDGLAMEVLNKSKLFKTMPNTAKFFSSGAILKNNFATSDWSLPSLASIFTGLSSIEHKLWHPSDLTALNPSLPYLPKKLNDIGFNNFQISSNWRQSPFYGYAKDFDRSLYLRNATDEDSIKKFFESDEKLKNTKRFFFLTLFSLHKNNDTQLDLFSNSIDINKTIKSTTRKSVEIEFKHELNDKYLNAIRYMDNQLRALYGYLNKLSKNTNVTVMMVSDHGQSFITQGKNNDMLSESRVKVPIFIYSKKVHNPNYLNVSSNADILPIAMSLVDGTTSAKEILTLISANKPIRQIALSESIYPNKPYELLLVTDRSKYHFKTAGKVSNAGQIPIESLQDLTLEKIDREERTLVLNKIKATKLIIENHNKEL